MRVIREDSFVRRLAAEWIKHDKLIVSIDFDDTIFPYNKDLVDHYGTDMVIDRIKRFQDDAILIIWTASPSDRYDYIREYCNDMDLNIQSVNSAALPDLKFGTDSKPYFNVHIDDRVCPPMITLGFIEKAHLQFKAYKRLK